MDGFFWHFFLGNFDVLEGHFRGRFVSNFLFFSREGDFKSF